MVEWRWVNVFMRDILLVIVIFFLNKMVNFQSWWVACMSGMIFVLITWHINDMINERRFLE